MQKRLLVIDDDGDIRDLIREIFEDDGYVVRCLPNVYDIFAELRQFYPDVVLVDYRLQHNDGTNIAHDIKSNPGTVNIPVVLFSGHHQRIEAMGNSGWDAFVAKPFDVDEIKKVVGKFAKKTAS